MLRSWMTFVLAVLAPLSGLSAEPGYLRLKRVEIVDRHGFEKPMPAMSMLVPTDWSFDGQVRYAQKVGDPADLVRLAFRTASTDGRLAIEMFPGWSWAWADDPMMRQAMQNQSAMTAQLGGARTELGPPMSARDFLTRVAVPRLRPGATVLGVEPIPDLEAALQGQVKQAQAMAASTGMQMRLRADHARARLQLPPGKAPGRMAPQWSSPAPPPCQIDEPRHRSDGAVRRLPVRGRKLFDAGTSGRAPRPPEALPHRPLHRPRLDPCVAAASRRSGEHERGEPRGRAIGRRSSPSPPRTPAASSARLPEPAALGGPEQRALERRDARGWNFPTPTGEDVSSATITRTPGRTERRVRDERRAGVQPRAGPPGGWTELQPVRH
jgi:hypothetical protein